MNSTESGLSCQANQDTLDLARGLLVEGVGIAPGPICSATGKYRNHMRLSCACEWQSRIERALTAIARLLQKAEFSRQGM